MRTFRNSTRWSVAAAAGLLAVSALPATAAPAPGAATAPVPGRYLHQKLDWRPCDGGALECAPMAVPRDWRHPDAGPDLTVEVSRHRATGPGPRRGVLMMAAGGPGASGLDRPAGFAAHSPDLAAAYDVVGFDQRGVGASTRVVCSDQPTVDAFFATDLRDRSAPAVRATFERARSFVRDCRRASGDLLPYLTTDQAVHDMDLFRALLGAARISYYGPSYATFLGAYYATEFPGRVQRMVLDSNVDFSGSWEAFMTGQPLSFQRRYTEDFLPWLAARDAVYHQGRTPAEAAAGYERLRRSLRDHPLDLDGTRVGPDNLDVFATDSLYNTAGFAPLATALGVLARPEGADPAVRAALARRLQHPMDARFFADFFTVTCGDTPWNRSPDHWVRQSARETREHPLAGARELTFAAICASWPRAAAVPHIEVTGRGLPPVLMLNSEHDPATYYEGALRAHRALPTSRLVTVTGGGDHGQFQNGNACVDALVTGYLLDDRVPAGDTACAANPLPAAAAARR
ncbi:alpha/beta hydrolase [Streptomyces sp. NPDC059070]|uniref:alpha/beta hydrolase n=1 Tax=Streptomyces sp. NPDC059070 TaxID=3346713 RepID=UPI0036B0D722